MKRKTRLIPLSVILISVMMGVILLLFIIITSLFYKQNADIALKVAKEFGVVASSDILSEFESYFNNAENALNSFYNIVQSGAIDLNNAEEWQDVMEGIIASDEKLNALYMADFNGAFYMAKRMKDNSISRRHVYRTDTKIVSQWVHQKDENKFKFPKYVESSLEEGYDPRKRPWYKNANQKNIAWTDPYIFFSDSIFGITGTRRIELDGFEAVISIDISLDYLADFITQLPFSNVGAILVNDQAENLIAYHDIFLANSQKSNSNYLLNLSFLKKGKVVLSNEVKRMLLDFNKVSSDREAQYREIGHKSIINILTNLLFPSSNLNSLENINVNSKTFANFFLYKGNRYIYIVDNLNKFKGINWSIFFILQDKTLVGDFQNTLKLGLVLLTVIFIMVMIIYSKFLRKISDKIYSISELMSKIISLKLDSPYEDTEESLKIKEIENIGEVYNSVVKSLNSFKKFVPQEVIAESIYKGTEITARMEQKKNLSFLFSDIVSFTSITEKFSPLQLSDALNIYFTELCKPIIDQNGIVDKFIGDAIMALFGVFDEDMNHAEQACIAALKMQIAHKRINEKIAELSDIQFQTRIGVNSGPALVGVLGSTQKYNFTAIGDMVNVTSRLEGLNKSYNTSILISESTKNMLGTGFKFKQLDSIQLKGKEEFTTIFQLYGYSRQKQESKDVQKNDDSTIENKGDDQEDIKQDLQIFIPYVPVDDIDMLFNEGSYVTKIDDEYFDDDRILNDE